MHAVNKDLPGAPIIPMRPGCPGGPIIPGAPFRPKIPISLRIGNIIQLLTGDEGNI